ncbi:MOSC domain-containing protein [Bythopirellula polymerisocia]|nr:MOSC domain-containing protein [Bythopirellula polymerisocia]
MHQTLHLTLDEMESQLDFIRQSPDDDGVLEMIVCRPDVDQRQMLFEAEVDPARGLLGDSWLARGDYKGGPAHPDTQINIMNSHVISLLAQDRERWQLAGDQLYVDFDLSDENLPVGSQLAIGSAVLEVTSEPHTGCKKFAQRYGPAATKFVNSPEGKRLHLRGINARIIKAGTIRTGDAIKKVA